MSLTTFAKRLALLPEEEPRIKEQEDTDAYC